MPLISTSRQIDCHPNASTIRLVACANLEQVPDEARQCAGCGTAHPPLHELTDGIFACENCIDATLAVLPKIPTATDNEGSDLDCNRY